VIEVQSQAGPIELVEQVTSAPNACGAMRVCPACAGRGAPVTRRTARARTCAPGHAEDRATMATPSTPNGGAIVASSLCAGDVPTAAKIPMAT
jgi:hypothetical protein